MTVQDSEKAIDIASPLPRKSRQAKVVWRNNVVTVGGDAPVRVQSMTNTDTVEAVETAIQVRQLAQAGSEMVRITVNTPEAAAAVPEAATGISSAAAVAKGSVLEFKAVTQSWVKVKDASGKVVLEKTLAKDESVTAEGTLPLSVIVGNAKGTQVMVRGEPFDISTTRDNVARFEVK